MSAQTFIKIVFALLIFSIRPASAHDPNAIPDMVERVKHGTVSISTKKLAKPGDEGSKPENPKLPEGSPFEDFFEDFFNRQQRSDRPRRVNSLGSGFVIETSGLIVTNNHVITGADEIFVSFSDGTKLKVDKIVGTDSKTDIALLQVKPSKPLTTLTFGDSSKLRLGEQIIAIGNPIGLATSVSSGIVSGLNRDMNAGPYDAFIQTDAAINKGNSGGPLLNLKGEVIGVNTAIISPTVSWLGIGFAVPANTVKPVLEQIRKFGETRRGWLGVRIQTVTDDIATSLGMEKAHGVLISGVTPGSPAQKAGLKLGDAIIEFNGQKVATSKRLSVAVARTSPGKPATVVVLRKGKRKTLSVVLGLLPKELRPAEEKGANKVAGAVSDATGPFKALGMTFNDLTPTIRKKLSINSRVKSGVAITDVDADSAAAEKRIVAGHVVMEIGQQKIASAKDAAKFLQAAKDAGRKSALMLVSNKKGDLRFLTVPLDGFKIEPAGGTSGAAPATGKKSVRELEKLE